jgi:hypothetical protein
LAPTRFDPQHQREREREREREGMVKTYPWKSKRKGAGVMFVSDTKYFKIRSNQRELLLLVYALFCPVPIYSVPSLTI